MCIGRVGGVGVFAAATVLAVAAALPAAAIPSAEPRLRLLERRPLALAGADFAPREKVRVSVSDRETTRIRRVTASARGSFRVAFAADSYDRCSALVARATGVRGSRALLKLPQPLCPPPLHVP